MCEKCPIDQRYPYYGFPVTPDSRKLRDEAERYREIAIRCFVAERDHPEMCETYDDLPVVQPVDDKPMPELDGHTIVDFVKDFNDVYALLSKEEPTVYRLATSKFDNGEYPEPVLKAFNRFRGDVVSSDREGAAFIMALDQLTRKTVEPEPDTVEIPEVPPVPSKDTPKVIAQHGVKARVVTIPGGKSVKELADVFGGAAWLP